VTRVAYELSGRPAALVVDLAAAVAGWRVGDREAQVTDVLALAPADEVARLIRRALAEIRAHAAANDRAAEPLRRLAAEVWRDYRRAIDGVGEQSRLPGVS
jgi:hypothetical protein